MKSASSGMQPSFVSRCITAIRQVLVEPSTSVTDNTVRRKVRLLSSFLIFFTLLMITGAWSSSVSGSRIVPFMVLTCLLLGLSYALSRTSLYRIATVMAVTVPALPSFIALYTFPENGNQTISVMWIVLPLLFSSLLLPLRSSLIIAVTYVAAIGMLLPFTVLPVSLIAESGSFILITSLFLLAVSVVRQQDRHDVEQQLSDRIRAEETLAESEEKYRNLFEASPVGIGITTVEGKCIHTNQALAQMLGLGADEMKGHNITDSYVNPDDRRTLLKLLKRDGKLSEITVHLQRKDGTRFYVSMGIWQVRINEEDMLQATFIDITDRKKAEEALRKSEHELEVIFDASSDAMKLIDRDFNIIRINPAMAEMDGMSAGLVVGKKCYDVAKSQRCHTGDCRLAVAVRTQQRQSFESEITRADGSSVTCIITVTPVMDEAGNVAGVLADFVDIEARKQMEEELKALSEKEASSASEWQSLFDASVDISTLISPDHKFLRANRATCQALGRSQGDLIGEKCYEIVHGLDGPIEGCPCVKALESKKPEVTEISDRGRHYIASAAPVFGFDGSVISFAHTIHDITERNHLEEQLRHSQVLASLGQMTAGIAHEVGNPLANIVLYSEMALKNGGVSRQTKLDLKVIFDEAKRAGKLMKDLLVYGRKVQPRMQEVNLTEVLTKVVELRRYQQKVRNIEVTFDSGDEMLPVKGNTAQLTQVFLNLLLNAEEAVLSSGGGNIRVSSIRDDDRVRAVVTDDGPGIPLEHLDQIFLPFFTTREVGKGTGLGLSTCYGIITSHGGTITADNDRAGGATFTVELPLLEKES